MKKKKMKKTYVGYFWLKPNWLFLELILVGETSNANLLLKSEEKRLKMNETPAGF